MPAHVLFRRSIGNRCQKKSFYQDNLNRTTTVILLAIISLLVTEQESIILPWSFPACWHLLPAAASWSLVSQPPGLLSLRWGPFLPGIPEDQEHVFILLELQFLLWYQRLGKYRIGNFLASSLGCFPLAGANSPQSTSSFQLDKMFWTFCIKIFGSSVRPI